jgi:acetyl esterase/lipase
MRYDRAAYHQAHMDISNVAAELQASMRAVPALPLGSPLGRRLMRFLGLLAPAAKIDGVAIEQRRDAHTQVRLYRPGKVQSQAALFWIHGGGYVIGRAAQDDRLCSVTAQALGFNVVSVEYRLAPKHPFPAALDDCHAGWRWLQQHAPELGIDAARITMGGESAGGGLAAGLAQRIHDEGGIQPMAQWLICPMLDDRTAARRELDAVDHFIWNNRLNAIGWRAYLNAEPGAPHVPAYATPARREDLRGLPPAWIGVGDIDLFYEEDRAYAERLHAAGVDVTLDVVTGAPHGFGAWAPETQIARTFVARGHAWLQRCLDAV